MLSLDSVKDLKHMVEKKLELQRSSSILFTRAKSLKMANHYHITTLKMGQQSNWCLNQEGPHVSLLNS